MSSDRLLDGLLADLEALQSTPPTDKLEGLLESALLRAGELECALLDHFGDAQPETSIVSAHVTDLLAQALLTPALHRHLASQAQQLCKQLSCPPNLEVSPPEGFCFYALHPLSYADLALKLGLKDASIAVIGIRTIGTTLSAVVAAAICKDRGNSAPGVKRIAVRPGGHPYDRHARFSDDQRDFVRKHHAKNSTFLVVDEGPGLSGSSFLSVAEALTREGIPNEKIKLLTSHEVSPESLVAPNAAARWQGFHSLAVNSERCLPLPERDLLLDGDWRQHIFIQPKYDRSSYRNPRLWPAVWGTMSSLKFFSADSHCASPSTIFKFEGLGAFGAVVRERANLVHDAGFGPRPITAANGFTAYPMLNGRLLTIDDLTPDLLDHMAHYIAWRRSELSVEANATDQAALENMTCFNLAQITGSEPKTSFHLELCHPVIADARMMPHEWMRSETADGRIHKLDAAAHGDNHFFPGPTDIAWDLAGVIVEWKLDSAATDAFLRTYERLAGDSPRSRLPGYLMAYSAFHAGYAMMAAASMDDDAEKSRLLRDFEGYRGLLVQFAAASVKACVM